MSIGKKFLLACSLILLVSIPLTGGMLNTMYYRTLLSSTGGYTSVLVEQIAVNLNTRTREYEDSIYNTVQQWRLFDDYFNNQNSTDYHNRGMMSSFVNTRNTTKSFVLDMYVLDQKEELYYYNYASQSFRGGLASVEDRIRGQEADLPGGARAIWFTVPEDDRAVYLMRCFYDVTTLQYEGIVAVGIERSLIERQFEMLESSQNGRLLIVGENDKVVFGGEEGLPNLGELLALGERVSSEGELMEIGSDRFLFQCKYSEDGKWKVMYLITDEELMGQAQQVKSVIATVCIVSMLAALIFATLISREITKEIRYLIDHMQQMKEGKWQKIAPPFPRDEIGDITMTYNQMVEDLQEAVKQLADQMMRTERAQYQALQAEFMELQAMVNPHFIYNAMESINARAKLAGQEEISMLCTRLGRLMRAAIRPKMELIPLEMELEYVEAYLNIQKSMMKDRLEVFYDFDESPEGYRIPALLLQPLVENAVVHGVENMKEGAVIVVEVSRETHFDRECLVIRISDNGAGMDEETLSGLFHQSGEEKKFHYGVQSVVRRIQICCGEPYGVFADSHPGEGTTFTVILPGDSQENYPILRKEKYENEAGGVD